MVDLVEPQDGFEADRILTEQGRWVHINRPIDAPEASMFGGGEIIPDLGPTLRDQFAMAALTAATVIVGEMRSVHVEVIGHEVAIAGAAYSIADAMLAERECAS